jgi:hypothetical protein
MPDNGLQPCSRFGQILACFPAIVAILLYWWILPRLRANFPSLSPYEQHLILQFDHTLVPQIILFVLTVWALIYQWRIKRSLVEGICMIINFVFAFFAGFCLLLALLHIDPMPRQM